MNINHTIKNVQQVLKDNSPAILTAIGVSGTVSTAVLTARSAFRFGRRYQYYVDSMYEESRTVKELFKEEWKDFIPPVAVGATTVTAILFANHISSKRSAALVTAYSLSERAFGEYKDKVMEQFGANKEQKVRDEIVQDRVTNNQPKTAEIYVTGNGEVLCMELFTGRYFKSSVEKMRKAMNDINSTILTDMSASLNELWGEFGLPATSMGEELGFNLDCMVDLQFSAVMSDDNQPCIGVGYAKLPRAEYHKVL